MSGVGESVVGGQRSARLGFTTQMVLRSRLVLVLPQSSNNNLVVSSRKHLWVYANELFYLHISAFKPAGLLPEKRRLARSASASTSASSSWLLCVHCVST